MKHTMKLRTEDKNVVSWQMTNVTNIDTSPPEKLDLKPTIVSYKSVDGITTARTRYTDNFHFYEKDVIIGRSIKIYGEYTQIELDLLAQYINENIIVYDVGGNIGYHTVAFAHRAKHVYSFEPNLKNYKLLEMNTKNLNNVTIVKAAVSDTKGKSFISDYELDNNGNYGECMMSETSGQPCATIRLDDLNLPDPQVIKIDVEGHELKVFNGARNIITKNTPIIFYEAMHGSGFDQIYDFLHTDLGYNLYWIAVPNYNPRNYNNVSQNVFGQGGVINILALPKQYPVDSYLEKMVDRNDTHVKFLQRLQERFNRG